MISTVMANANAAILPMARSRQPEHAATTASSSKATEFADQIARLEKTQASQAEARKSSGKPDQPEKPDASESLDTSDTAADSMAGDLPVPAPRKPQQPKGDDIAIAIAVPIEPRPVPGSGEQIVPSMQKRPNSIDLRSINDGQRNMSNITNESNEAIGALAITSKNFAPISGQSDGNNQFNNPSNNQSETIGNTIPTSQINGPMSSQLSADIGAIGDMQALVNEFETSINHFERAGNQWVGNAKIVFQSTVLSGTSVQITGDGKSLSIQLVQSALSSTMASLHHQEKQLCDALTRRLGRTVTVHIGQTLDLDTQAADDAEPQ